MASAFFPATDTGLLAWSQNFATLISSGPPTVYGLTSSQSTAMTALVTSYSTALAACEPGNRSKSLVATKNSARKSMKDEIRLLAKIIDGQATVTDAQKYALGLTVRATPSPIPLPSDAPNLDIASRSGTSVTIKLHDGTGSKRGKPAGVQGASVFSFVGATRPSRPPAGHFKATRPRQPWTLPSHRPCLPARSFGSPHSGTTRAD